MSIAERRHAAALEFIRATDSLRLLQQIALARHEPPELWIGEPELLAVKTAREALIHGYFRVTSARR
jgi:hypothetical protein